MPFECPICKQETKTLVIPQDGKLAGRCCANVAPTKYNVNLGQTLDSWKHVDKQGVEHTHRLTVGKSWEIDQRRVSPEDNKVVINNKTGKETSY